MKHHDVTKYYIDYIIHLGTSQCQRRSLYSTVCSYAIPVPTSEASASMTHLPLRGLSRVTPLMSQRLYMSRKEPYQTDPSSVRATVDWSKSRKWRWGKTSSFTSRCRWASLQTTPAVAVYPIPVRIFSIRNNYCCKRSICDDLAVCPENLNWLFCSDI